MILQNGFNSVYQNVLQTCALYRTTLFVYVYTSMQDYAHTHVHSGSSFHMAEKHMCQPVIHLKIGTHASSQKVGL